MNLLASMRAKIKCWGWRLLGMLGAMLLTGCASALPKACTFPKTSPMLVAQLFFGRGGVSDTAWRSFTADALTRNFPDGFTALDAAGQWRKAPGTPIEREASELVVIAAPDTQATRERLQNVMNAYLDRFHQDSVGLVLQHGCAAF